MPTITYPPALPLPDTAPVTPAELRIRGPEGPFVVATRTRDMHLSQEMSWTLSDGEADVWWAWYRDTLADGAFAFSAPWPHPDGQPTHTYRFSTAPSQQHLADTGARRISASLVVRGASRAPQTP